ncbi:hypothetical protein [Teredinibacter waterburyi]|jgi:hypothetical protein|uniref:hypothetical protein n=1 Tax=Teredinibacter waterburyi TaxID=1500538 RepID=UPI00165F6AE9|nr:hypothetical protein [Teredinibacter waterburyi]
MSSLVSVTHVALVRARRELDRAFEEGDWERVRYWDAQLGQRLNRAFEDEERDTNGLIEELERVLKLYAQIVSALPEHAISLSNPLAGREF